MKICPNCKGKGFLWQQFGEDDVEKEFCEWCNGEGKIDDNN